MPVRATPSPPTANELNDEPTTRRARGWERLGAAAQERRERNRRGWAGVTEHYRAVARA